jgi:hypothetical protein
MNIKFEIDDNNLVYEVLDGLFLSLLKNHMKIDQEILDDSSNSYMHIDDLMQIQANISAYKHLIKYYSNPSELDDDTSRT